MRFAHVWSLRFSSRHLKGWLAAFQASGPPVVPSPTRGLAQLGVVFACAHCYKLCVVGWTRVFALSALPSTPGWSRTPLCLYPAGGGATGDCQAVALALWSQPLVGPGREPFCVLTQDFCLVLSVTGSGDPVAGEGSAALPPRFFPLSWLSRVQLQLPVPFSGSLPCSPPARASYYQETCTHFNPRAGAGGARMDTQKGCEALPHPTPRPIATGQSHGFRYPPPVSFPLHPQF